MSSLVLLFSSIFLQAIQTKWRLIWPALAGAFVFFSFFTKQDGGGLALLVCLALLIYDAIIEKRWQPTASFLGGLIINRIAHYSSAHKIFVRLLVQPWTTASQLAHFHFRYR